MAKPVVLPADVIQTINMIKATYVDPNDFQNAVQECFNRGYGKQGQWILDHKELYLQALQDGYIAEADVPISEHIAPPKPDGEYGPPVIDQADAGINPQPVETETEQSEEVTQKSSETEEETGSTETPASEESGEEPEGRKRKHK